MSDHDLWHVKLSEGCVVEMTLDEIDTAFNAGRISARTSVMPPGDFRWTTLGDAAGLEDDPQEDRATEPAPYSIAPVAYETDATPQPPLYDLSDGIDVDLESNAGLPRKRKGVFGKVVGVTALFAVLIAAGVGGGAYAARPVEFKAKVASVKDRFTKGSSAPKAAAAAQPPPPVQSSREIPPPPPAAETAAPAPVPAPAPTPTMQASSSGTSVTNLPDAKGKKAVPAKKKK
jgi:hypothetical protein